MQKRPTSKTIVNELESKGEQLEFSFDKSNLAVELFNWHVAGSIAQGQSPPDHTMIITSSM